jgi:lipopolysaccharide export system protein LptA
MITLKHAALAAGALLLTVPVLQSPVLAQAASKERAAGFGNFGSSKEPIKIDADRLDVFDKEGRAVFTGNVVAVQGDSTMNCTLMTVFYEQNRDQAGGKSVMPTTQGTDDTSIKKIDCKGPVTIVSKTQVATGNDATFDRQANKIYLIGNAALSDGPNVTRGERVVYDLNTGVANVETKPGGRVRALFVPGSSSDPAAAGAKAGDNKPNDAKAKPQPKPATR